MLGLSARVPWDEIILKKGNGFISFMQVLSGWKIAGAKLHLVIHDARERGKVIKAMYTLRKLLMNYQSFVILGFTTLLIGLLARGMTQVAHAQPLPPPGAGYVDFFYGLNAGPKSNTPTESKPESKLWWNDGFWWASMYNATTTHYHI